MATVDDLLRGAQLVRNAEAPPRAGMELEHLAAWCSLSRSARRVLDAVPGQGGPRDHAIAECLKRLETRGVRSLAMPEVEADLSSADVLWGEQANSRVG